MSNRINDAAIPVTVAVIFHSGYGHTARQAEAVRRGIERVANASALYLTSDEAQARLSDLELADAMIFGAPTYMGSVSGPFKTFMDSTSKLYSTGAWKDKIAAGHYAMIIDFLDGNRRGLQAMLMDMSNRCAIDQ